MTTQKPARRTNKMQSNNSTYNPNTATPPSETLKEVLENNNLTPETLATKTGISLNTVNDLLANKRQMDRRMAESIAIATGIKPQFWMSLTQKYITRMATE